MIRRNVTDQFTQRPGFGLQNGPLLQTQQIASSRLRAIEQHRWVVQASPTGFSAFISPEGDVYQRTGVSEQRVPVRTTASQWRRA